MIWESEWYRYKGEGDGDPSFQIRVSAREQNPGAVVVQLRVGDKLGTFGVPTSMVRQFITDLVTVCAYAEKLPGRLQPAFGKKDDDQDGD